MAAVSYGKPHVLILDEPTNNLDLEARFLTLLSPSHSFPHRGLRSSCAQAVEALAASVETFDGGVVVVSHDQYFVSRTHTAQYPHAYRSYSASLCGAWNFL